MNNKEIYKMKKIQNYIMLLALALVAVCCSEEDIVTPNNSAKSGDEVQFNLSLNSDSRTIYGTELNNAFPIYWVNGDKVQIISPKCLGGKNNAEYSVTPNIETPYFADALTKTGAYGVQWGDNETANFYSIYPSGNYTMDTNETIINNLEISEYQEFEVPDANGICNPKMNECLMLATSKDVAKGNTVSLTYSPIATSIRLTLNAAPSSDANSAAFQIQTVSLSAFDKEGKNVNIVGTFGLNVENKIVSGWMTNDNKEVMATNTVKATIGGDASTGYYTMQPGKSLTIPFFIAPQKDLTIQYWVIDVYTDQGQYTKTITNDLTLKAGMVHKLTLPTLTKDSNKEWDVKNWMVNIPRNVYLSEISIPGSWNSLNSDFQGASPSISAQYNKGVRAFHLDTRWSTTETAGYSFTDPYYLLSELSSSNMYLSVADGGQGRDVRERAGLGVIGAAQSLGQVMDKNNTPFETYLKEITTNVKSDEYMVLFCSFAQGSYNDVNKSGKTWMQAISDACSNNNAVYNAQSISPNTTVGDVLGSVIVIVNCENAIANETLPKDSKCLFVNVPNNLTSAYFPTSGFKSDNLHFTTSTATSTADITMAVSQAQITSSTGSTIPDGTRGYYPSFTERTNVVNAILDWSKDNYGSKDYNHDKWIYLGLGGNTASYKSSTGDDDTAYDVTTVYSPLIDNRIAAMGSNGVPYYPVGIVYMNYTTTDSYKATVNSSEITIKPTETVKNILMLNNKYRLQYDKEKPAFPITSLSAVDYDSYVTNGSNAITSK